MPEEEKTEEATPKKRKDERKKGNVLQSKDINMAISIFVSFFALYLLIPYIYKNMTELMIYFFSIGDSITTIGTGDMRSVSIQLFGRILLLVLPMALVCMAVSVTTTLFQTKLLVSFESIKPKFSKLNPLSGLKRMISLRSLVELVKNLLKITIIGLMVYSTIKAVLLKVPSVFDMDIHAVLAFTGSEIMALVSKIALVFFAIAVLDFFYQRWEFEKKLKMSKQEVKQEYKQMEGDPQIKQQRRQMQQQMAKSRMMQQVPSADVVVRNPTHFAVALKYAENENSAPIVVAKGQDYIALKIIEIAQEAKVPALESPALARTIFRTVAVGQEILPEQYQAVAEVFAWVYRLNQRN